MTPEELDAIETRANSDTSVEEWLEDTYALIAEVRRLRDIETDRYEDHEEKMRQWLRAEAAEAALAIEVKYRDEMLMPALNSVRERAEAAEARANLAERNLKPYEDERVRLQEELRIAWAAHQRAEAAEARVRELEEKYDA